MENVNFEQTLVKIVEAKKECKIQDIATALHLVTPIDIFINVQIRKNYPWRGNLVWVDGVSFEETVMKVIDLREAKDRYLDLEGGRSAWIKLYKSNNGYSTHGCEFVFGTPEMLFGKEIVEHEVRSILDVIDQNPLTATGILTTDQGAYFLSSGVLGVKVEKI